jgi:DNA-binding NtrC family response regulator
MERKTLLLLDVDGDCEEMVAKAAARQDRALLLARTAREAFEIITNQIHSLELIVVDVDPGTHGLALLEAISAQAERPPMIVVTALEEAYMNPIAAEHGAAACLGKPLSLPRLIATLQQVEMHRGLTCDRWGSLVPAPVKKWADTRAQFRGIAGKLSPSQSGPPGNDKAPSEKK